MFKITNWIVHPTASYIALSHTIITMSDWKSKISIKRQSIVDATPKGWRITPESVGGDFAAPAAFENALNAVLTPEELKLTSDYTAQDLLLMLSHKSISSESVVTAFSKRAAIAGQLTSCLTEVCYAEAIERAKQLDEIIEKTGKPVGPLHGLPVSVKDSFNIKGLSSTIGCVSRINNEPAQENTPLVQLLWDLGAVFYVKTNLPQGIITSDSHNNVFGRTLNPYNTAEWSAGGSSGGEAALIALRGSLLGVGTDLAGSIRIPAWCCGVYGFKPSINRVPYAGIETSGWDLASTGILASAGPLATSLSDLEYFMKVVIGAQPWVKYDPTSLPLPWVNNKSPKKTLDQDEHVLNVGFLFKDDVIGVYADVRLAFEAAAKKIQAAGHNVEMLKPGDYPSLFDVSRDVTFPLLSVDNSNESLKTIMAGKEPLVPSVKKIFQELYLPQAPDLDDVDENHIITSVVTGTMTLEDLLNANRGQLEARKKWLELFNSKRLDVVICPCTCLFSSKFDTLLELPFVSNWNSMDVCLTAQTFSAYLTIFFSFPP